MNFGEDQARRRCCMKDFMTENTMSERNKDNSRILSKVKAKKDMVRNI